MHFPFERATVCEVNRDVVRASRDHFAPWLEGLFDDPRVRVIPEDGRTWLAVTDQRHDLIVGDIFLSYKAGVGSLYTLEHFETVRDHLALGGVFVQWLPTFDISPEEFSILARTMLEVFPSVTLWRRSFSPVFPVYALVGSMESKPLDPDGLRRGLGHLRRHGGLDERVWILNIPLAGYVANLSRLRDRFADAPLNTDDRTLLEYSAPVTERNANGAGIARRLAWDELLRFCEDLLAAAPPESDPYLADMTMAQKAQVRAGTAFYGSEVARRLGDEAGERAYRAKYRALVAR
jgi:spermidine synthase